MLLRKAKKIHKSLGITVPLPVDSESVMDTVLKALFLRREDSDQMYFDFGKPVEVVHQKWDRAVEKERKSRTRFAQHAIKPDEVAKELEVTDSILGNPTVVEKFVQTAIQRIGSPLIKGTGYWKVDLTGLPKAVYAKIPDGNLSKITFDQPVAEDVTLVSRNYPLTGALAEHLFDIALQPDGDRNIAARCGVIRSGDVDTVTTLLLLRLRFLIKHKANGFKSLAEECMVSGFRDTIGSEKWLTKEESESLFEEAAPSENISDNDKRYWVTTILNDFDKIRHKVDNVAENRTEDIFNSYERLRKTIKGSHVSIEALLPVDVLSLNIIVPQPKL